MLLYIIPILTVAWTFGTKYFHCFKYFWQYYLLVFITQCFIKRCFIKRCFIKQCFTIILCSERKYFHYSIISKNIFIFFLHKFLNFEFNSLCIFIIPHIFSAYFLFINIFITILYIFWGSFLFVIMSSSLLFGSFLSFYFFSCYFYSLHFSNSYLFPIRLEVHWHIWHVRSGQDFIHVLSWSSPMLTIGPLHL